ncbi:MAG: TetR/AcrR family transcriptional regulator [Alcaligenaceae bacterium]|nr:TetR/AcrR family transcriptional regulator [Alcaligenaceae bacterium]
MKNIPRNLPSEERRAATVMALVALAGEQNPSDITTTDIAKRMGLTQGALFRHFPNKEAILLTTLAAISECFLSRVDKAAKNITSPLEALEAIFMAHVNYVSEFPGVSRFILAELQRPDGTLSKQKVLIFNQHYKERILKQLKAGVALGELNPELDVDAAAILFMGAIQGLVTQSLTISDAVQMHLDSPKVFALYRQVICNMVNTK